MRKFHVGDIVSWLGEDYQVVRVNFLGAEPNREPYVVLGKKEYYVYEKNVVAVYNSADFVEDLV